MEVIITGNVDVVQIELVGLHLHGELALCGGGVERELSLTYHKFIPERCEGEVSGPSEVLYEETDIEGFSLTAPGGGERHLGPAESGGVCPHSDEEEDEEEGCCLHAEL